MEALSNSISCTLYTIVSVADRHPLRQKRKSCEKCSKIAERTTERRHWLCSGVFIINFEHAVFHTFILLFLLTLSSPFLSPSPQFSPVIYYLFSSPCSHLIPLKKPVGFLMFSEGSKGSIGQKRVKFLTLILLHNGCSFNCWKNICNMFCTTFFTEFENLTLCVP